MAYTRYVNTASTAGGDGTTNNTTGATRAYASLETALSSEAGTLSDDLIISCCGSPETITGSASVSASYVEGGFTITVQGNESETDGAHEGKWSDSHYALQKSASSGYILRNEGNSGVTFKRFQVRNTNAGADNAYCLRLTDGGTTTLDGMIIRQNDYGTAIFHENTGNTTTVKASFIYSDNQTAANGSEGIYLPVSGTLNVYNCTIRNFNDGIERDNGTVTVTNSAVFDNNDDFDGTMTISYCGSDDGDGTNSQSPASSDWANEFPNYSTGDPEIVNTGNMYGNGTDLSGSGVTEDITGATIVNDSIGCSDAPIPVAGGNLAGTISAGATVSGDLKGRGTLSGSISAGVTPTGNLKATGLMSGSIVAGVTVSGNLVGVSKISGTISAGVTVSGDLGAKALGGLAGSIDASVSVTGNLIGRSKLSGSIGAGVTVSGDLGSISIGSLAGSIDAGATLSGILGAQVSLIGAINAGIALSGVLTGSGIEAPQSGGAPITHRKAETLKEYYEKRLSKDQIRGLKLAYGMPEVKKELEESYQEVIEEIEEIPDFEPELIQSKIEDFIEFVDLRITKLKTETDEIEEALVIAIIHAHNRR